MNNCGFFHCIFVINVTPTQKKKKKEKKKFAKCFHLPAVKSEGSGRRRQTVRLVAATEVHLYCGDLMLSRTCRQPFQ